VYLEAEAVLSIISRCENGEWTLLSSGTIDFEIAQITSLEIQEQIYTLYASANEHTSITDEVIVRAKEFQASNIKYFDSLHMALAERANADILLTTDDRLIKRAQNTDTKTRVANPVKWLMEVTDNEQ
jgi:predicted nucleic acid-binding protein